MNISLDISLYPLTPDYKKPILGFIEALRKYPEIEMLTNPLSTQLYGDFDLVWAALGKELQSAFGAEFTEIAVIKIVSVDVNG